MAKIKITLDDEPTFSSTVEIPAPGGRPVPTGFTFKGRTRNEFKQWIDELPNKSNVEAIMEVATGWDLPFAFNEDNITKFDNKYLAAAGAILDKYSSEMQQARTGN